MAATLVTVFSVLAGVCLVVRAQATANDSTLIVTTVAHKPFLYHDDGHFEGLVVDIINEAENMLNKTFVWQHVRDGLFGGQRDDLSWSGMFGEVQRGEADIAAAALTMTSHRANHVDFSLPFMTTGYRILVSKTLARQQDIHMFHMLLTPLEPGLWILSVVLGAGVVILLCLIAKFSPWERAEAGGRLVSLDQKGITIANAIYFAFSACTKQGYRFTPRSLSGRILTVAWWSFTVLIITVYGANLTAFLLFKAPALKTLPFLTFEEMASQSAVDFGMVATGSTMRYFQNSKKDVEKKVWKQIWSKVDYLPISMEDGVRRARQEKFAFIMESASAQYYAARQPCDLMVVGETRSQISYGFVCRKGSGICKLLDSAILKLKETARLDEIQRKWFSGECALPGAEEFVTFTQRPEAIGSGSTGSNQEEFPISMNRFLVPIVLLAVGILIGICTLVGEIFWARKYGDPSVATKDDRRHFAVETQELS